jgi:hypothetical protein
MEFDTTKVKPGIAHNEVWFLQARYDLWTGGIS